jgi:ribosomal protein S17
MNVAIIDDGIDERTLDSYNGSIANLISQGSKISPTKQYNEPTHGGLCADVFYETTGRLPDVSICLPRDDSGRCNINDLALALDWCASNNIDLINLSMGTTRFFDSFILRNTMERLQNSGTILVAGANNKGLLTYPAVFESCIGVCCDYGLKANEIAYIDKPFDGINIATYPVTLKRRNITGTNSISTAYISGIIHNELGSDLSIESIHNFFREKSINVNNDWKRGYLKQKVSRTPEYESIVIVIISQSHKQTTEYITELQKHIIHDEYTCAIHSENNQNNPSDYVFSFETSPMSRTETLNYITKSCRPNVILTDSDELTDYADIIAFNNFEKNPEITSKIKCFNNISAYDLWKETKKLYEE